METIISHADAVVNSFADCGARQRTDNAGMDFHRRLVALRERAQMSQAQLAAACGRGQSWLGNFERGDGFPRVPEIYKLAETLMVHPGELFAELPSSSQSQELGNPDDMIVVAADALAAAREHFNLDLGEGSDGGAVLAAFHALRAGKAREAALSAVLAYAADNGGAYAPKRAERDRGGAGGKGQPAA